MPLTAAGKAQPRGWKPTAGVLGGMVSGPCRALVPPQDKDSECTDSAGPPGTGRPKGRGYCMLPEAEHQL